MDLPNNIQSFLLRTLRRSRVYRTGVKSCCCFHDENDGSFYVFYSDPDGDFFFKCHGCGKAGTLEYLMKVLDGPAYQNAPSEPRQHEPVEVPLSKLDSTLGFPDFFDYFISRGVSAEVCKRFGFKFDVQRNAAIMPIYTGGLYLGRVSRNLTLGAPRYTFEPDMPISRAVWALDAVDPTQPTYIMEGIIDAACWWSQGHQAIALISGKQWQGKFDLLQHLQQAICVPDNNDRNSFQSFHELAVRLCGRLCLIPVGYTDTSDYVTRYPVCR